jgi:hypothetical protein
VKRDVVRAVFFAFLVASAVYQSFWGDGWSAAIFGVLIGHHILAPWVNGRPSLFRDGEKRKMTEKITDWWGKLVVALDRAEYEVLAKNDMKDQTIIQLKDGSVYSIERLGATLRDE